MFSFKNCGATTPRPPTRLHDLVLNDLSTGTTLQLPLLPPQQLAAADTHIDNVDRNLSVSTLWDLNAYVLRHD
jgi:hypothetical protein